MTDELPDTLTIKLRKPVEFAKVQFEELPLREPTAGELRKVSALRGYDLSIQIVALVTGIPEPAVANIGQRDMDKAMEYLSGFSKPDPKPGE